MTGNQTPGLYIHIPFCKSKCPYCHFAVRPFRGEEVASLVDTLLLEWDYRKKEIKEISTLYLGGGTPSLLPLPELERLLQGLLPCHKEVTIEVNPEDVTLEKLQGYRALGINRISLGVQSFADERLKTIGRNHTTTMILDAIEMIHQAEFSNFSIDLMYDLPDQTLTEWKKTVDQAVQIAPAHISLYNLTFEPGALYYKEKKNLIKRLPQEEISEKMLGYAVETFENAGLMRYEISAFAKPGYQAKHNTSYWIGKPFLGIGPSAFSFIDGARFRNASHTPKWQRAVQNGLDPTDFHEALPYPRNVHELLVIHLRLLQGVDLSMFNLPKTTLLQIERLIAGGYLTKQENRLALSEHGRLFYDSVAAELI